MPELPGRAHPTTEEIPVINPRTPRMHLLTGSEWSLAITDSGAGISVCRGLDIHMRSGDLLRRPQGIFAYADAGGVSSHRRSGLPVYRFPKRGPARVERRAEFGEGYAALFAGQGSLETGMRVTVHPRLPSEQRQVALKNRSNRRLTCQLLFYFEPCLAPGRTPLPIPPFPIVSLRPPGRGLLRSVLHPPSAAGRTTGMPGGGVAGRWSL